ncbi:MAG: hypothetical protein JWO32_1424 [Bacteroidetes bacterium]|nr:hypothetical protein [Bacteroidota bacterium]
MDSYQTILVSGVIFTAILGIYNLFINIKSQRRVQRELVFNKQFEFFVQLFALIALVEHAITDCSEGYSESAIAHKNLLTYTHQMDLLVTKNEFIIPDHLYKPIYDFTKHCWNTVGISKNNSSSINRDYDLQFSNLTVDLQEVIREYLGIDKLSSENKKLVYSKF